MVVVAVVGAVICQVVLQAGPRGGGVTAAEGNAVQQVAAVHITPDTTAKRRGNKFLLPFFPLWHIVLLSWRSSVVSLWLAKLNVLSSLWDVLTFSF